MHFLEAVSDDNKYRHIVTKLRATVLQITFQKCMQVGQIKTILFGCYTIETGKVI